VSFPEKHRHSSSLQHPVTANLDSLQSVWPERLLEHLLIGDLLRHSWLHAGATLEVSQPSIDRSGHDVVLEANGVTRHLQLKSSATGAATASQKKFISACSENLPAA